MTEKALTAKFHVRLMHTKTLIFNKLDTQFCVIKNCFTQIQLKKKK